MSVSDQVRQLERILATLREANAFRAASLRDYQAVKRSEQPFVDGNTFYIQFDRELFG